MGLHSRKLEKFETFDIFVVQLHPTFFPQNANRKPYCFNAQVTGNAQKFSWFEQKL